MIKIKSQKNGSLTEAERLQIGTLLLKAGYTVRLGKEKQSTAGTSKYEYFVEAQEAGGKWE